MGTNSRDLRVRFTADTTDLQGGFQEVRSGAATAGAALRGTDDSARTVSQSFTRTGKALKATGRIYRASGADALSAGSAFASTIPALSGVAAGAGQALTAVDALGGVLAGAGPAGLATVGAAAVGAAAAYALLHDDVSAATDALRDQQKVNVELAKTHQETGKAVGEQKQALRDLEDNTNRQKTAAISLEEANRNLADQQKAGGKESLAYREAQVALEKATVKVADAERKHGQDSVQYRSALLDREKATRKVADAEAAGGKGSLEYQRALLAQQQAQQEVNRAKQDAIPLAVAAITNTRTSSKAVDDEVKKTHEAADAARARAQQIRLGLISGDDAEKASKEIARTLQAEAKASAQSAAKHKDNAQTAKDLADAVGTATPRAKALRDKLLELARTELNLAAQSAAARDFGSTVRATTSDLLTLYTNLRNPPAFSIPGGLGGGGGGGGIRSPVFKGGVNPNPGGGRQKAGEVNPATKSEDARRALTPRRGELSPISRSDRAQAAIDARHRDDSLQDTLARERAPIGGITNPDKITAIQDKAVAEVRKREIDADAATTRKAIAQVEGDIRKKRSDLAKARKTRQKTPRQIKGKGKDLVDNPKWKAADDRVNALIDAIRSLWDEHRDLRRDYAELQAEAKELGHEIGNLETQIAGMSSSVEGTASAGDVAVAEASLTPGLADDIAASQQQEREAQAGLDAARASGDQNRIVDAIARLKAARDNTANLINQQAQAAEQDNSAINQQLQARAQAATAQANSTDAFLRSLAGGANIDPATVAPMIQYNVSAGMVVRESDLAAYFVKSVASQPFIRRSVFPSAA